MNVLHFWTRMQVLIDVMHVLAVWLALLVFEGFYVFS